MSEAARALELPARHYRLELRRACWIRAQRLSPIEAADLPASFDPGPEFDPIPTPEPAQACSPFA